MNNSIVFFLTGLILGGLAIGFALYKSSPDILLKENQSKYDIEQSIAILQAEADETGWNITNRHDLQATLIKHGKKDPGKTVVVELCNPDLAAEILAPDEAKVVSNMMPCRIALYEKSDGNIYYSRMNSGLLARAMGGMVKGHMKAAHDDIEDMLSLIESE